MHVFLHGRLETLARVLEGSNAALRAHSAGDTAETAAAHLDEASEAYRTLGLADAENQVLSLKAELSSARRGWHPVTLERVQTRRREMERSIALHVLTTTAERLRSDCAEAQRTLLETRERMVPIVLYALQKGSLSPDPLGRMTQGELERAWQSLDHDPEIQTAARQVALTVSAADIALILGDLLSSVGSSEKRPTGPRHHNRST